jgi:hypothetical protein
MQAEIPVLLPGARSKRGKLQCHAISPHIGDQKMWFSAIGDQEIIRLTTTTNDEVGC